jgi:hypothetical protein
MTTTTTIATVTGMHYDSAETRHHSGIKSHQLRGGYLRGGRIVRGGYGTYITVTPAHLVLEVSVKGKDCEVWTERDFRDALGVSRLTEKTRDLIESTKPETVKLEMQVGRLGTEYWVLAEETLQAWVGRIEARR